MSPIVRSLEGEWRGDMRQRSVVNGVPDRGEEDRIGREAPGHEDI